MAIRMSGLASGLDTESIIRELMAAQRTKQKKLTDKQTTGQWVQDKWKSLNTKLYSFHTQELNTLRKQGTFLTRKVTSSNDIKATATAGINAPKGAHRLEVKSMASSQFVTGGKVQTADGKAASSSTKLVDLGISDGTLLSIAGKEGTMNGGVPTYKPGEFAQLKVTKDTTIADFVKACKGTGLQASFDEQQSRLFISSGDSGSGQKFTITSSEGAYQNAYNGMLNALNADSLSAADKRALEDDLKKISDPDSQQYVRDYLAAADPDAYRTALQNRTDITADEKTKYLAAVDVAKDFMDKAYDNALTPKTLESATAFVKDTIREDYFQDKAAGEINRIDYITQDEYDAAIQAKVDEYKANKSTDFLNEVKTEVENRYNADKVNYDTQIDAKVVDLQDQAKAQMSADLLTYQNGSTQSMLVKLGLDEITGAAAAPPSGTDGMTVKAAADAVIVLDGAEMTGASNTFTVNGITLNLKGETDPGETILLNVQNDTDAIYDTVKNYVKKYNELLLEMNTMYSAPAAKDMEPLTDEQRQAMSDKEIETWEDKIKDSLLRRDGTINGITSAMRNSVTVRVQRDGKTVSFASLGISTSSDYTEKGLLHIYGDKEDSTYGSEDDKLRAMIESDPEAVMELLNKSGQQLYDDFTKKMERKTNVKSSLKFYNDVTMQNEQRDYKKKINAMEERLQEMEARYYKQFTAMEKALSQLQSQGNAMTSMMGGK